MDNVLFQDKSSEIVNEVSRLEEALSNSNDKIADLLKVKEKYAELLNEKQNQTMTITELEEQVIEERLVFTTLTLFDLLESASRSFSFDCISVLKV